MSLYPIVLTESIVLSVEPNLLPAGAMIVVPIDMMLLQMTRITLQQLSNTQDFGMRAWVSLNPDGFALGAGNYPILKFGGFPIMIHTQSYSPPDDSFAILVSSGNYFVNILNLTNITSIFGFSKTDVA